MRNHPRLDSAPAHDFVLVFHRIRPPAMILSLFSIELVFRLAMIASTAAQMRAGKLICRIKCIYYISYVIYATVAAIHQAIHQALFICKVVAFHRMVCRPSSLTSSTRSGMVSTLVNVHDGVPMALFIRSASGQDASRTISICKRCKRCGQLMRATRSLGTQPAKGGDLWGGGL